MHHTPFDMFPKSIQNEIKRKNKNFDENKSTIVYGIVGEIIFVKEPDNTIEIINIESLQSDENFGTGYHKDKDILFIKNLTLYRT